MMSLPTFLEGERLSRTEQYGGRAAPRDARASLRAAMTRLAQKVM